MKNNKILYTALIIVSVILIALSLTVLGNTTFAAPIIIALSLYLFIGALIKLCKTSQRLKETVICAIDILWWLP